MTSPAALLYATLSQSYSLAWFVRLFKIINQFLKILPLLHCQIIPLLLLALLVQLTWGGFRGVDFFITVQIAAFATPLSLGCELRRWPRFVWLSGQLVSSFLLEAAWFQWKELLLNLESSQVELLIFQHCVGRFVASRQQEVTEKRWEMIIIVRRRFHLLAFDFSRHVLLFRIFTLSSALPLTQLCWACNNHFHQSFLFALQ